MSSLNRYTWQVSVGLLFLNLAIGSAVAAESPFSPSIQVSGSLVSWLPEADYDRIELRVDGPTGELTRTFLAGEVPSLDLAELEGLVDGLYTFELTVFLLQAGPEASPETVTKTVFLRASEGHFASAENEAPLPRRQIEDRAEAGESLRTLAAETVIAQDLIVKGSACIGGVDCLSNESFGLDTLRLKEEDLRIHFDDTSSSGPDNDWRLTINDSGTGAGAGRFSIDDVTGSTTPFTVLAGAADNSLFIDSGGDVGLGTSIPSSPLHVRRTDGTAQVLVQETSATTAPRVLLNLENNGAAQIRLKNTTNPAVWVVANASGGVLRIHDAASANFELQLGSDGDLTLEGEIFTAGSCSAGCDRVFQDGYELESIADHAELMWANSHLPGVGPTPESGPMNLSQKALGILNELEKAHIYIEQLHGRLQQSQTELADVRTEMARQKEELGAEIESLRQMVVGLARARSRP